MSCLGCGATHTKRHQKVFCSNRCQRAMERRRNVEQWLATGVAQPSSGVGHYIRLHLLEEQRDLCAICGCSTTWQGLELRFVLDHVDGDASNNHRDNLRLVWPQLRFTAAHLQGAQPWQRSSLASPALRRRQVVLTVAVEPVHETSGSADERTSVSVSRS